MEQFVQQLVAEKDRLVSELSSIANYNEQTGDWVAQPEKLSGDADQNVTADTTEDWNERRALVAQLEMRFHSVTLALSKLDRGTFGHCEVCNEEIELDRLEANPAARTCKIHLERERELPL